MSLIGKCPWCSGELVFQDEFFERGYKARYKCLVCGSNVWFDSHGNRTKPHLTWERREWEKKVRAAQQTRVSP